MQDGPSDLEPGQTWREVRSPAGWTVVLILIAAVCAAFYLATLLIADIEEQPSTVCGLDRDEWEYYESQLPLSKRQGVEILRRVDVFLPGMIGISATTELPVHAFKAVYEGPTPLEDFLFLLQHGQPAGQLYALCGLYRLDRDTFEREAGRYKNRTEKVEWIISCSGGESEMRDLVFGSRNQRMYSVIGGQLPGSLRQVRNRRFATTDSPAPTGDGGKAESPIRGTEQEPSVESNGNPK